MKRVTQNLSIFIALFISITFYAQEFKNTNDFSITEFKSVLNSTKNDSTTQVQLYLLNNNEEPIAKLINIDKDDLDFFLNATIEVLKNPELSNVKSIIKVEFEFLACCTNYESLYFIQKNDDEIIKLPQLDYMYCEYATDKMEYIFPNQKFGKSNAILTTESYLDINQKTESVNIVNTTIWEEKDVVLEYSYNYNN